ncbi:SDR family NAD(P)-dependent oxidoreductase, partial [Mycobacterium tuberculosis]|uniref:SDR family NAD(P)-dependent oxidoreductase n=1 Tax=Mycobacterium tuberculosis TaxID=1773 RepID=UPI001F265F7D
MAAQVHRDHGVPLLVGHVEQHPVAGDAGIVHHDVQSALDASDVVDEIGAAAADAGAKAVAVAGDISQRATADELLASAVGLGGLDIVVNNAGITRDRMLFNMSDEE